MQYSNETNLEYSTYIKLKHNQLYIYAEWWSRWVFNFIILPNNKKVIFPTLCKSWMLVFTRENNIIISMQHLKRVYVGIYILFDLLQLDDVYYDIYRLLKKHYQVLMVFHPQHRPQYWNTTKKLSTCMSSLILMYDIS